MSEGWYMGGLFFRGGIFGGAPTRMSGNGGGWGGGFV